MMYIPPCGPILTRLDKTQVGLIQKSLFIFLFANEDTRDSFLVSLEAWRSIAEEQYFTREMKKQFSSSLTETVQDSL